MVTEYRINSLKFSSFSKSFTIDFYFYSWPVLKREYKTYTHKQSEREREREREREKREKRQIG